MQILRRSLLTLLMTLLLAIAFARAGDAQGLQLHEREIKAGLLYNFLKYTEFPEASLGGSSISLCLFGGDPFGGYLSHTNGLTVHQKPIAVRSISSAGEAAGCQLVFVNAASREDWNALAGALEGRQVLTVSDFGGFVKSGGMIEFSRSGDHVSVVMNMDAVNAAHLHVGDRLLRLVTVVHAGKR